MLRKLHDLPVESLSLFNSSVLSKNYWVPVGSPQHINLAGHLFLNYMAQAVSLQMLYNKLNCQKYPVSSHYLCCWSCAAELEVLSWLLLGTAFIPYSSENIFGWREISWYSTATDYNLLCLISHKSQGNEILPDIFKYLG